MVFSTKVPHSKALLESGTTWTNEMNFGMNHAPGAGLIALPVDMQYSAL